MKLVPLDDRVVVQRLEAEETTGGGTLDDGSRSGIEVKEGDTVLFGRYSGTEITIDGEDYLIMKESELLAVLT